MTYEPGDEYYEAHLKGHCTSCGAPCTSITQDVGIGPYEYWGARGVDTQLIEVSPCCEATVDEVSMPCHARCQRYIDHACTLLIPEKVVDGKTCTWFRPHDWTPEDELWLERQLNAKEREKFLAVYTEEEWLEWITNRVFYTKWQCKTSRCPICFVFMPEGKEPKHLMTHSTDYWHGVCSSCMPTPGFSVIADCIHKHRNFSNRFMAIWERLERLNIV